MTEPAITLPPVLVRRQEESEQRLSQVRALAEGFHLETDYPSVVVYATGSIGRKEAGANSDLDIFCVDVEADETRQVGKLQSIQLFNDLIKINRSVEFPPFSGDGRFLVVHRLEDVLKFLGTSSDDHRNLFTARMLMLLESNVLFGRDAYDAAIDQVIDLYWRDCTDPSGFRPTFLINDLVRYWKTLCLAHEAGRLIDGHEDDEERLRLRVAVLKLQFNRIWMVFNGLAYLLSGFEDNGLPRSHVERLVQLTPVERMLEIASRIEDTREDVDALLGQYAWFLEATDKPKADVQAFFGDQDNYREGRDRGDEFGDRMSVLVNKVAADTPMSRYLLI